MKKINFLLIALVLSACSPQVTVTSQVTVTLAPPTIIPTPTLHPKFIELQNLINDSSERFTLLPDGTLEETTADGGRKIVPNLYVDQNGIINIIFNNERVAIDQSQITFDDEKGLTIDSYELENGEWVEAKETVILGGVTLTLDENGVVTEMSVEGNYTDEQKAEKLAAVDPTNWGFEEGEAQIVKDTTGTHIVVYGENVAKWIGTEWEWDWRVMEGLNGGNPLFKIAKTYEMNGKSPEDMESARADSAKLQVFATEEQSRIPGDQLSQPIYLYNGDDRSVAIIGYSLTDPNDKVMGLNEGNSAIADGTVCFMNNFGELVSMKIEYVVLVRRGFN